MRYAADHKEKTRRRILEAAAVVFRRKGFQAGSVDDVMAQAGLTAGGFYAHFASKDELFAEAMVQTLSEARVLRGKEDESLSGADHVRSIARKYLSPAHRKMVEQGCVMPPLLADVSRQNEPARRSIQNIVAETIATLQPHLNEAGLRDPDQAYALLALMIGGMTLARSTADEELSDRILSACRALIDTALATSGEHSG
ncbi:MAG: TetR/AcrR family transcriptional regulator [Planctomycetaceae bacterium]